MSLHLVGYTPWEAESVTVDGTTYLGVIANYYADFVTDIDINDTYSRYITLPNGTNAVICTGSNLTVMSGGVNYRAVSSDSRFAWRRQPMSDWSHYATIDEMEDYVGEHIDSAKSNLFYEHGQYGAGKTINYLSYNAVTKKWEVVTRDIEITSAQVSDLTTTISTALSDYYTSTETDTAISDAITAYQTDTADHRYLRIGTGTALSNGTDINTCKTLGKYRNSNASNGCRNMPLEVAGRPFTLVVENMYGASRYKQTLWLGQSLVVDRWYYRIMTNDTDWSDWYKVEGTAVATDVPTP